MFPTKEAGDYFNERFVIRKYELDKGDPDNISVYGIRSYPTFIFLDAEGNDLARMYGGSVTAEEFIKRVKESVAEENRLPVRNERFKNDPDYAVEHLKYLFTNFSVKGVEKAIMLRLKNRPLKENFDVRSIEFYKTCIYDIHSPLIEYMVRNRDGVVGILGEECYMDFLKYKVDEALFTNHFNHKAGEEPTSEILLYITENGLPKTFFYEFFRETNGKDFSTTITTATTFCKKADSETRKKIFNCIRFTASNTEGGICESENKLLNNLITICYESETNSELKNFYKVGE